jgi:ABC-2 type transport system ATP-binding protein
VPPRFALEVCDLVKRYGSATALDGVSASFPLGAVTALLGPNGAGKTTLVECCEGYRRPDSGVISVLGLDPVVDGAALRARVGVMLQEGGIYSGIRAVEMLRHVAGLYAHPLDVAELVDLLGLASCGRTPYRRLSGGQQRRLSLALAVVGRPEVVFLDEPTAGLDVQARLRAWELVEHLREAGVSVVLTTHDMDEAERLADHVVVIDRGRVVATGTPAELTTAEQGRMSFHGPARRDLTPLQRALPAPVRVSEPEPGRYLVEGPVDPQVLATVVSWCADQGFAPRDVRTGRRTLEDVFVSLTGRALR